MNDRGWIEDLPDGAARHAAITTLDRPVLVEAGAGTGKTTLLVEHVLHALAQGTARMPAVVAITFTEKAAAELRLRLRQELEARLERDDTNGAVRTRWAHALLEFDQATVSTIHAFASGLLRARPVEAEIDSGFRVMDEVESAHVFREFWNRWVDAHVDDAATAADLRVALLAGVRIAPDLESLARELDVQRDLVAGLTVRPAADLTARMEAFAAAAAAARAHAERHCRDPGDGGLESLHAVVARLAELRRLPAESRPGVFLEPLRVDAHSGRADRWDAGQCAASKSMRKQLRQDLDAVRQAVSDTLLHGMLAWLSRFAADFAAEKRRRAVLDFQDLLVYAQRLLRDHPDARRHLAAQIQLLCVDEFQDTDPLQAEIVWFLSEAESTAARWEDAVVGPKLFLVGDPKQSIYRFRRADLDVYEACAARIAACGGLRIDIVHNFRSRPAILDWVNGVFETLFAGDGPRHVALRGAADRLPTPAVWRVQPAYPGGGADAQRRAEADALVAWIARALHERWPVRDRDGERALEPRDVALLFARTAGIEIYEAALRAAGLPFQQEGGRLFFERQEVRDVLQALAAIDDPHDELALAATLRSPLFGASDEDLWQHRVRHGGFDYLQPPPDARLGPPLAILARLHAERHTAGIAGTIVALLDRTGARAFHATQPSAAQALSNLEMLQRHARQFEVGRGADLREFVRALYDIPGDAPRMAEWAPQDADENRIRVLTVHMAKGLEFACVALANVGARANTHTPAVLVDRVHGGLEARFTPTDADAAIATAGYAAAAVRERGRDEAEERRLLYVAATRARDYLVVPDPAADTAGFGKLLRAAPAALGDTGPLGAFVAAGAGLPPARACVVDVADLPVPVRPRSASAARADLGVATRRRDDWAAAHAQHIQRGGAGPQTLVAPPVAAVESWPWRAWLAQVLAAVEAGEPIAAAAQRVARAHGSFDRGDELASLATAAAAYAARRESTRRRYGVQITTTDGGYWTETWLDLVHDGADGLWVVLWMRDDSMPVAGVDAALAALVRASGRPLAGAGALHLGDGSFVALAP